MSLPPVTVQIKRKRTDEPVDFLQIHESNKRRATAFIFSRQPSSDQILATKATPPELRRIKQLAHSSSAPSLSTPASTLKSRDATSSAEGSGLRGTETPPSQADGTNTPSDVGSTPASPGGFQLPQPRRFHISRSATPTIPSESSAPGRKRKVEPTVFIERRKRPRTPEGEASSRKNDTSTPSTAEPQAPRPQKKPGLAARTSTPTKPPAALKPSPAPLRNVRLPSGAVIPWDINSEQLAAEMQAYTLQEIGRNIAQSEAERPVPNPASVARHGTSSKFKPKKPALRYAERHPSEKTDMAMDVDEDFIEEESADESEYIIDTFVRIPAEALASSESPNKIGLLVLESQPDIDEFYKEDDESEEEEDDDDEDENAEDHYTADYPEDEVDSDDEFDRNAYNYRNGNASDNEEYDEDYDEAHHSDDEGSKYPWAKQPVWMKREKTILDDDDL